MTIDRDKTTLWRGIAILGIVVHNILVGNFGFVGCNEMTFKIAKTEAFWGSLTRPSIMLLGDLFAFWGWIGVPVFVFISGFGLETKYGKGSLNSSSFLASNYRKLITLLLPAVLLYSLLFLFSRDWLSLLSSVLSLSLLGNVWYMVLPLNPSIYWYFGLTWELYLFYLIFRLIHKSHTSMNICMLIWSLVGFLLMAIAYWAFKESSQSLEWLRRNFIGWVPIFCLGIWVANTKRNLRLPSNWLLLVLMALVLFVIICIASFNFYSWLFVPLIALLLLLVLGEIFCLMNLTKKLFVWIGGLSSYLFVVHPMARGIAHKVFGNHIVLMLFSYLLLTFAMAICFKYAKEKISQRI